MKKKYWVAALLVVISVPMMALAGSKRERALAEKKKHIEANVPTKSDFDVFLRRDLAKYFREKTGRQLEVEYELLRDKPFQAGKKYFSAYPKFYLWIKLYENNKLVNKGAARVAAVEKKHFEVITFADKKRSNKRIMTLLHFFQLASVLR
jgi:hypothetical protein